MAVSGISGGNSYSSGVKDYDPSNLYNSLSDSQKIAYDEILSTFGDWFKGRSSGGGGLDGPGLGSAYKPPPKGGGRPDGDNRSAEEILDGAAGNVVNRLGKQKDIKLELLKQRCGDWTANNPDPKSRADAAYNIREVLEYIDSSKSADGRDRGGAAGDGNIEGITKDGDARHGTEAGLLKDFAENGYSVFDGTHRLHRTNDSHVRWDGSNKDNFQWFLGEVGEKLFFIPGVGNILKAIGDSKGGIGGMFSAGLDALLKTFEGGAQGLANALKNGTVDPMSILTQIYAGTINSSNSPGTASPGDIS
ncbi:hypothetical protein [Noviherbaspirillum aridicola]|uniref:Uncharacterized protein n=1 Tax=Noviherbaspirillum aridicola TaxID=2849687 RepID=A0ABQ4Q982_9BURK|nr:hypothetical protein [Noviherbaspirillum aridicola]GIZ53627.1 hypothetical protein NCCP691_36410 [Noviherbaspirillum aridicola]